VLYFSHGRNHRIINTPKPLFEILISLEKKPPATSAGGFSRISAVLIPAFTVSRKTGILISEIPGFPKDRNPYFSDFRLSEKSKSCFSGLRKADSLISRLQPSSKTDIPVSFPGTGVLPFPALSRPLPGHLQVFFQDRAEIEGTEIIGRRLRPADHLHASVRLQQEFRAS
jgi:hypothetical protein